MICTGSEHGAVLSGPGRRRGGVGSGLGRLKSRVARRFTGLPVMSSLSHQSEAVEANVERESRGSESLASAEIAGPGLDSAVQDERRADDGEIELELTLGFEPFKRDVKPKVLTTKEAVGSVEDDAGLCKMELGLDYPAS
ncbi:UNVERIFIED_CONTAM: hypothetical protein Scaly_2149500 [Sesamum calycinum]|uniref:Uncharacterized protein n=1 Tax=Sesamum calycinum TaxID=2727403 RepID=A0AAW2MMU0_9LAMI